MTTLCKGMSFARGAIENYVRTIEMKLTNVRLDDPIEDIVQQELSSGTAKGGGKKNPSVSRCILRLLWMFEFVEALLRSSYIPEANADNYKTGAVKAYEETLGTHHTWIVRKGVASVLASLPDRKTMYSKLEGKADCSVPTMIRDIQKELKTIHDAVHHILEEADLLEIN